jgi:hypothetical protein
MNSYIDNQLQIIEKIDNNILSEIKNYYYKYICITEKEFIQESLTKSKNKIEGNENMKKSNDYQNIIDISAEILNNNGFPVNKDEWFLELHKYNITNDMYINKTKKEFIKDNKYNPTKISQFMFQNENINEKLYRRYSDFEWHDDDCNNNFNCHTVIFFLKKTPKNNVGGNFYWKPKGEDGKEMQQKKIKILDNMVLLMRGDIWHSPGWILSDKIQKINRELLVVQIKKI